MDTDNVHEAAVSKRNFPRRSKAMKKVMKKMLIAGMACVCGAVPVSYTHLRAHETDSYLVCRLLLEKKKKHRIQHDRNSA